MSLESVVEDIRARGAKQAEDIRKDAREEAERILKDAQAKKKAILEAALVEARRAAERLRIQETARIELENRRAHLVMQKDLMDLTIEKARERILHMPQEKDRDIMRRLLAKHGPMAPVVISCRRHEAMVKSLAPGLKYGGNIECMGGIILQTVDGSVRYDLRYETLLDQVAQRTMKDVARTLFQG